MFNMSIWGINSYETFNGSTNNKYISLTCMPTITFLNLFKVERSYSTPKKTTHSVSFPIFLWEYLSNLYGPRNAEDAYYTKTFSENLKVNEHVWNKIHAALRYIYTLTFLNKSNCLSPSMVVLFLTKVICFSPSIIIISIWKAAARF